jgi:hypothetical protein
MRRPIKPVKLVFSILLLVCSYGFSQAPSSHPILADLFREHKSRMDFMKMVGQAMAAGVSGQPVTEAKMNYGLQSGDAEYLINNLDNFERTLPIYDATKATKYLTKESFAEKVEYVKELKASMVSKQPEAQASPTTTNDRQRVTELENQLATLSRQVEEMQTAQPEEEVVVEAAPPADPSLGDPNLWPMVTQKSLGRVFIPGKGWLHVGPRGPIDTGGNGVVGRVNTREEVKARNLAKEAAAAGMSVESYAIYKSQQESNMKRERLIREMQSLTHEINRLRR